MGSGESAETNRKKLEIASNEKIASQNLAFQKEKLEYDKQLQQQIFNREDSAYQRTVSDMRAAGVSPLAMQGTNGAGGVVQTEAPQNGMLYDYTSGMSTDMEKLGQLINAVGAISTAAQSIQQVKSMQLDNQYKSDTLDSRKALMEAQSISAAYDSADKQQKRWYNAVYNLNDEMTEFERKQMILSSILGYGNNFESARTAGDYISNPNNYKHFIHDFESDTLGNLLDILEYKMSSQIKARLNHWQHKTLFGGK